MKTKEKRQGISLIVLIITIIVVIILAAVVILTLSKNNPIESAKEARFKEDVITFQDELALTVSKQYTTAGGHRDEKITTSDFDEIKEYIPSFSEKYKDKFIIQDDELRYTKQLDDKEKEYAQSLNVKEKQKLLPDEYQQVEYIESTGTQYIDTGYLAQLDTRFVCKVKFTDLNIGTRNGTYGNNSNGCRYYFGTLNGLFIVGYGDVNGYNHNVATADTYVHEISIDNSHFLVDGISLLDYNRSWTSTVGNIILFAIITYDNNGVLGKGNQILYYSNIYNNNTLVRGFVPCYSTTTVTNVDGEICDEGTAGLYDLVEGKFYTNKGDKTKGDFICGPEV